jgi:hypothetical protein
MTEDSAPLPVASAAGTDHIHPDHLRKEGWTMARYVWSLAARSALGSGPYCSASLCWSLLSSSPDSNTRWRVTSSLCLMASPHWRSPRARR